MALFGGAERDGEFFKSVNIELVRDIVDTEVAYYKFDKSNTNTDVYGESKQAQYYQPHLIPCLVKREDQNWSVGNSGDDLNQTIQFTFVYDMLVDLELKPEQGDVIEFNKEYWEIDSYKENNFYIARNPDTNYAGPEWGYNANVIVTGRYKKRSSLRGIIPENLQNDADYFD